MMNVSLHLAAVAVLTLNQARDTTGRTQTITMTERAGIARTQTPVEVTVRFPRGEVKDANAVRVFRVDAGSKTGVPCQILSVESSDAKDSFAPLSQTFVRLVFLADVGANKTSSYEVALGGAAATNGKALRVSGTGVGRKLSTGPAVFELHPPSGQLLAMTLGNGTGNRLMFQQSRERGELPIHWNPDVWPVGRVWGHTSDWTSPVEFDPARHKTENPPPDSAKKYSFFYRESTGPILYRLVRWGRMPFAPEVDVSVTYTFHAGAPVVWVETLMEFRGDLTVHAVRDAELVFSRHQLDTAFWTGKDGKLRTAAAYDYADKDRTFKEIKRLPADVPVVGLANERKNFGTALVNLNATSLNKLTGQPVEEGAHFYIRDYDEHGRGKQENFLYFVRPLVYRVGYLPTTVRAGSVLAARHAVLLFPLKSSGDRYEELVRWRKVLAEPLEVVVD